jgi:hypothetical protein
LAPVATYAVAVQLGRVRHQIGPLVMTVGAVIALVASFLGWVRSGETTRSSYDTLGLVHRLGFTPSGPAKLLVQAWPLMPLLLAIGVVAAWWGWRSAAAVFGCLGGFYAAVLGVVVSTAVPTSRQVGVSAAPAVTAVGGIVVIVGSVLCLGFRVRSAHANSR